MSQKKDAEDCQSEEPSSQTESYDANKSGTSETYDMKDFCPGIRIEAKDFDGKWYPAKVSDVDWTENEILVHFENWNTKFDEWIPMDSSRLRSLQKPSVQHKKEHIKFSKGEEVMAMWSPYQKYPATIQAVLPNDRYDVLFYDGFLKRLKSHKISKLENGTKKTEVPNFTDIGTKEERRERKRKINVAELFHINKRTKKKGLVHSKSQDIKTYPVTKSKNKSLTLGKPENTSTLDNNESGTGTESKEVRPKDEKLTTSGPTVSTKALVDTIPAAFEVKYINGQTEMWSKQLYQRSEGRTAGKLDIVILNPQGRKFRSRNEIMKYCEENGIMYSHEAFDFSAKGRPKSKPNPQTNKIEQNNEDKDKLSLKKSQKRSHLEVSMSASQNNSPVTPSEVLPTSETVTDQNKVFIGDFEVVIENGKFICPVKTCAKYFRRENLLHMHMKHYHPEFSKYLDYTPSVTDLAYARTVGGHDAAEVSSPAIRKSEKSEKTYSKVDNFRKASDTSFEYGKEAKKIKLNDSRSESKIYSGKGSNESSLPTPDSGDYSVDVSQKTSHSLLKNASNLNDFPYKNEFSNADKNGGTSFDVKASELNVPDSKSSSTASNSVMKSLRHKLNSRKKPNRFQGSFAEHMRKKKLISQDQSKSLSKVNRHQNSQHLRQQLQQPPSFAPSSMPAQSFVVDDVNANSTSPSQTIPRYPKPPLSLMNDMSESVEGAEDSKSGLVVENSKVEKLRRNEIINCVCGITEEDGLMIQCDLCLCWQHGHCTGIFRESDVPDKYVCAICKNPYRARSSMKYLHDQEWLKEGTLPSLSFRSKREEVINQRKTILKRSHDLSGSIALLARVIHSLRLKVNIAEKKDHPKLWLWAKKWTEKKPNRLKDDSEVKEEKPDINLDVGSGVKKEGDLGEDEKQVPKAPEPEAPIDSAECKLNLLDHLIHYQTLVDARLSCIESLVAELESMQDDAVNDEAPDRCPRTKATIQMLLRDLNTMKKIAII